MPRRRGRSSTSCLPLRGPGTTRAVPPGRQSTLSRSRPRTPVGTPPPATGSVNCVRPTRTRPRTARRRRRQPRPHQAQTSPSTPVAGPGRRRAAPSRRGWTACCPSSAIGRMTTNLPGRCPRGHAACGRKVRDQVSPGGPTADASPVTTGHGATTAISDPTTPLVPADVSCADSTPRFLVRPTSWSAVSVSRPAGFGSTASWLRSLRRGVDLVDESFPARASRLPAAHPSAPVRASAVVPATTALSAQRDRIARR